MTLDERCEHLFSVVSGSRFLKREGLGNELPFFVFTFKPSDFDKVIKKHDRIVADLAKKSIRALSINIYDLSVELLKDRGIWEDVISVEQEHTKNEIKELLQGVLSPEDYLIPAIENKSQCAEYDVMFITGLGEVFPYLRTHNILTSLQRIINSNSKPLVAFFPGAYVQSDEIGASLELFNEFSDDNYYRAFDIDNYEV